MSVRKLALTLCAFVLLALPVVALAQTVPPPPAPTVRNCTALSPEEALDLVVRLGGAPSGASLLAVYLCTGFGTNLVGDTVDLFNRTCTGGIAVYKVEDTARQGYWNVPGKICDGNTLSLYTGGTGHYILYGTAANAAESVPLIIVGGA